MDQKHVDKYVEEKQTLVRLAREAQQRGISYRGFKVGCALLAFNGQEYKIFQGANMKPFKQGPKYCAEGIALGSAQAEHYNFIVAIVVAGQPQSEYDKTLHPCLECVDLFLGFRLGLDTIIHTICESDQKPTEEFLFVDQLHNLTSAMISLTKSRESNPAAF